MSIEAAGVRLTTADTRIHITHRTARWDDRPATLSDALDFWSFAAGAANVVMQLSWPGVGHGVVESKVDSGNLMKHPWKRARTTFSYLAVAILGNPGDRAAYRDAVHAVHRQVRSELGSPVPYSGIGVAASGVRPAAALSDRGISRAGIPQTLQGEWTPGQQRRFEYLFLLVAFVNRFLPRFIRQGGSHLLLADVRRRIRRRNLI